MNCGILLPDKKTQAKRNYKTYLLFYMKDGDMRRELQFTPEKNDRTSELLRQVLYNVRAARIFPRLTSGEDFNNKLSLEENEKLHYM